MPPRTNDVSASLRASILAKASIHPLCVHLLIFSQLTSVLIVQCRLSSISFSRHAQIHFQFFLFVYDVDSELRQVGHIHCLMLSRGLSILDGLLQVLSRPESEDALASEG